MVYKSGFRSTVAEEEYRSDRDRRTEEYRCLLTEESTPVFNLLRQWRNERAKKDVSPPYIMFTNRQLAHIAAQSPDTLNQLSQVEGVGKAKIEKYGQDILTIVKNLKEQQKQTRQGKEPPKEQDKKEQSLQEQEKSGTLCDSKKEEKP